MKQSYCEPDCIGLCDAEAPARLVQSECADWISALAPPMHDDDGVIETNHVAQDGRTTNNSVPTNKSGDSSYAGAGSTKGCFGVQSENQKKIANEPEKEP